MLHLRAHNSHNMTTLGKPGHGIGGTITKDEALQLSRSTVRQRKWRRPRAANCQRRGERNGVRAAGYKISQDIEPGVQFRDLTSLKEHHVGGAYGSATCRRRKIWPVPGGMVMVAVAGCPTGVDGSWSMPVVNHSSRSVLYWTRYWMFPRRRG